MAQQFISRGFKGRARENYIPVKERIPSGQYETKDFPVLSAGPTPRRSLATWDFSIYGEIAEDLKWSWEEFRKLPRETVTVDIHCVTKWSKLDTVWTGVSPPRELGQQSPDQTPVLVAFLRRDHLPRRVGPYIRERFFASHHSHFDAAAAAELDELQSQDRPRDDGRHCVAAGGKTACVHLWTNGGGRGGRDLFTGFRIRTGTHQDRAIRANRIEILHHFEIQEVEHVILVMSIQIIMLIL